MSKTPGKVGFDQPNHGSKGTSAKKNKSEVGFAQRPAKAAGGTSSKKNPGSVPFTQKSAAFKGNKSKKTAGEAGFDQPNHGGSAPMPGVPDKTKVVQKKMTKEKRPQPNVGPSPKFTSISSLMSYRKKKYNV